MYDGPNVLGRRNRRQARQLRDRLKSVAKLLLAALAVLLLMSMGAQFYAAPVLLPALWFAARSSKGWAAAGFTFAAALLMTEIGWLIAYLIVREQQPWIIVGPVLGFSSTIAFFRMTRRRARGSVVSTR